MTPITCPELKERVAAGAVVVDVMTPEDFAACHVAGATNACIYEMVFLDRIAECAPDNHTELIVYDATGTTMAAEVARDRLLQAGYTNVTILAGGLAAWRNAGFTTETGQAPVAEREVQDGSYHIETAHSRLEWIGRNLNNRHYGGIAIKSGELDMAEGRPKSGFIEFDMNSIDNQDLTDAAWHDLLIRHLKSEDFFDVANYPAATFRLTGWEPQPGAPPDAPGGLATGALTIKGATRAISVPAIVAPQADGSIKAHAAFDIDRTLWKVNYGSAKLYERLGMHLVHDLISLELFIVAR